MFCGFMLIKLLVVEYSAYEPAHDEGSVTQAFEKIVSLTSNSLETRRAFMYSRERSSVNFLAIRGLIEFSYMQ